MSTLYLTNEVDGKYIISVVELQQDGEYYSLSKDDLTAITAYIAETAAAFAPEAVACPLSVNFQEGRCYEKTQQYKCFSKEN